MFDSGVVLGKYRILRLIGQGGMADVYEVEDTQLQRRMAMKVLPHELARDHERLARFMREVRHSAAVQHPNVVEVYDVGEVDGTHFYTMALLEGGDLKSRIQTGVSPEEALEVLRAIAVALGAAHAQDIVHRDVKPENIMFDSLGRAVLTDLGIARAIHVGTRMTKTGMSIGTPHYMSPEQIRGKEVDQRSDLYSLGIVFVEMLTGSLPYDAEDSFAVGFMHLNDPLPELPRPLAHYQRVVEKLLAKNPEHRFSDAAALIRCIEGLARAASRAGKGDTVYIPSSADPSVIRRLLVGGGFGVVLVLLLVGIWYRFWIQVPVPSGSGEVGGGGGGACRLKEMLQKI